MMSLSIQEYFSHDYRGVLLEVGAAFPEMGSAVSRLRKNGWDIISVEPNPVFCNEFRNAKLPVLEYAAHSEDIGESDFNVSSNGLSYSSLAFFKKTGTDMGDIKAEFNKDTAINCGLSNGFDWEWFPRNGETKKIKVQALTLNTILKKHYPELNKIDVMVVDVEGHEMNVMMGIDLNKYRPELIVIENIRSEPEYREYMASHGYELNQRIDIDDFYIKINTV